ncbi:GAF domain-containing sensor histidine kinase [Nocardioides sp.]|uniref:sensor histidine kinase n=1 Tax=Nocardioides sp. TaxID=35761 RepID=UPI002C42FA2F|nr:GAF domain-containing sensor histidine kinase [Nocardioides sp.]HXH80140.1 GAF domain-containing sensor histidine kinase [Nocardioides sp.]
MVSDEQIRTHALVHQGGWGEPAARSKLWRIANDLRRRAGFDICAIEVRRSDDRMEFVAIATDDPAARELEGQSSPLDAMFPVIDLGEVIGLFTFIPHEAVTDEAHASIEPYVVTPDLPYSDDPDAWHPQDMLVARLYDASNRLRAFVYFDVPCSLRRPSHDDLVKLSEDLDVTLQAIITTIEREEFAAGVRFATGARMVVRSADSRHGLPDLLRLATEELQKSFRATVLAVDVFGEALAMHPPGAVTMEDMPLLQAVRDSARRCWDRQRVLLVDGTGVWGDDQLAETSGGPLADLMTCHDWMELIVVPIGAGDEALGMLAIARGFGIASWSDDESSAALDVGHDLGRAILNARASERERQAAEELRRVDDYRTGLIATLAHELKNPIGVVAGHAEMLSMLDEEHDLPPAALVSLEAITRGADRLAILVDDLTTLSKVGDPAHELEAVPVDLGRLAMSVIDQSALAAGQRDIKLVYDAPPEPLIVLGDTTSLTSVITNLVTNAISYSDDGGSVRLALWCRDEEVVVECTDAGLGISSEDLTQLFTEFFRSTNREALVRPGTGLGLTITRRIVERHGGRIEVESELGSGSTFRVCLPLAVAPEAVVLT